MYHILWYPKCRVRILFPDVRIQPAVFIKGRECGYLMKQNEIMKKSVQEENKMTRNEFLSELRQALENDLSGSIVQENVEFYNQYITDEVRKGKSEEEVLTMLGDPWILARTVIDAANGTDQSTVYEAGGSSYTGYGSDKGRTTEEKNPQVHLFGLDSWWKKLLLVLGIVMIVLVVFAIVSGLIRLLAPILVPILVVMLIIRLVGSRRG